MAMDDEGRAFAYSGARPLTVHRAADSTLERWEPRQNVWNRSAMPLENRVGPGDPIMWKGNDGRWYAALAET